MSFGVLPTGFARKPLATILSEIEDANVASFGPQVIQTAQSTLGQLNGLLADLIDREWQVYEDVYQSFDPDQAEGVRLDQLARFRLLSRADDENDFDFRKAVTNVDRARIDLSDLKEALEGLEGVSYVRVYVNENPVTDANGVPPNTVAVAIIGGDDDEIADTVRRYVVPGIGQYGNTVIQTVINGFCRTIRVIRPVAVPVELEIDIIPRPDANGCAPPSLLSITTGILEELSGDNRPTNGQDGTLYIIRRAVEARYPNIEVTAIRISAEGGTPIAPPFVVSFFEIMTFDIDHIELTNVA